jgi:hypothetical protein
MLSTDIRISETAAGVDQYEVYYADEIGNASGRLAFCLAKMYLDCLGSSATDSRTQ